MAEEKLLWNEFDVKPHMIWENINLYGTEQETFLSLKAGLIIQ